MRGPGVLGPSPGFPLKTAGMTVGQTAGRTGGQPAGRTGGSRREGQGAAGGKDDFAKVSCKGKRGRVGGAERNADCGHPVYQVRQMGE